MYTFAPREMKDDLCDSNCKQRAREIESEKANEDIPELGTEVDIKNPLI
jgi:hypothetical protein